MANVWFMQHGWVGLDGLLGEGERIRFGFYLLELGFFVRSQSTTGNKQRTKKRRTLELSSIHIPGCVISQSICISGSKRQLVGASKLSKLGVCNHISDSR